LVPSFIGAFFCHSSTKASPFVILSIYIQIKECVG